MPEIMKIRLSSMPVYRLILQLLRINLRLHPVVGSIALGAAPFAVGWIVAKLLGDHEEFWMVSVRLPYWAVIACAFLLTSWVYGMFDEVKSHVDALHPGDSVSSRWCPFTSVPGQVATAVCVMGVVAFFYFFLQPSIESDFVYWYLAVALQGAAIAASFGVYFSFALMILVKRIAEFPDLRLLRMAPEETPGVRVLATINVYWAIAYMAGLLIILYGIVAGPWGTTIRTYRMVLAFGAVAISVLTVVTFFFVEHTLYRIVERRRLSDLGMLAKTMTGLGSVEVDQLLKMNELLAVMRARPVLFFRGWNLIRGLALAGAPWIFVAISNSPAAKTIGEVVGRQLGLFD